MVVCTSEKMLNIATSLIKDAQEFYGHIFLNRDDIQAEIIKDICQELNINNEHAKYIYEFVKNNVN